jgi:adenine-specific DNA-methyltransferase
MPCKDNFYKIQCVGSGSKNHCLFTGDNLDVMPKLLKNLKNKVDLQYVDLPYNTGKKMGYYNDNYGAHDAWVSEMRPRLELGKEFLSNSGSVWLSIGEKEEAHLKLLCNEIYGEENKVASIIWQSKYTVANDKRGISAQTEYILVYAKDASNIIINNDPLRDEYVRSTYKNIDDDPRGPWRGGIQLYKKKNKHSYTVTSPNGKQWTMPWNYSEDQWKNVLEKDNLLYWGKDGNSCPVKKVFLKDTDGAGIRNLWLGEEVGYTSDGDSMLENMFGDRNKFQYSKPVSLMKRIIEIASQPTSIVMDYFAGSGTLGHAVLECNRDYIDSDRSFIMITDNQNGYCDETTFPRLKKVVEGYQGKDGIIYAPTGGKVSYYKYEK